MYYVLFKSLRLTVGFCASNGFYIIIISFFLLTLQKRSYTFLPPLVLGALSILAGVVMFLLPETRHSRLPDTIEEVEGWNQNSTRATTFTRRNHLSGNTLDDRLFANIGTSESAYSVESTLVV